jgi:hypothetical protein
MTLLMAMTWPGQTGNEISKQKASLAKAQSSQRKAKDFFGFKTSSKGFSWRTLPAPSAYECGSASAGRELCVRQLLIPVYPG